MCFTAKLKTCVTKSSWENFFTENKHHIVNTPESKPLKEIFKHLKSDKQSFNYPTCFWEILLQGCISSWNLELGKEISDYTKPIPSADILIQSAEVYLQSGSPSLARATANRALRLRKIKPRQKLQLQIILCNSYVEEGKKTLALRLLKRSEKMTETSSLHQDHKADALLNIARSQFFLGRYLEAAPNFYKAYNIYLALKNWEGATKGLFNTAACYHNSGKQLQARATKLVLECQYLSEQKKLAGPLAHCHAFFGTCEHQKGFFEKASKHYKKAIQHLPENDNSFRRLHIMSMLSLTYLKMGRIKLGAKYGEHTIELASHDNSDRFRTRYDNIKAEILWNSGEVDQSQALLNRATAPLFTNGVNTLEELSVISRYSLQQANVDCKVTTTKIKIADSLKETTISWLEYLHSKSQLHLSNRKYSDALKVADESLETSKNYGSNYFIALSLLTRAQIKSSQRKFDSDFTAISKELTKCAKQIEGDPLRFHLTLLEAGYNYASANFDKTKHILLEMTKTKYLSAPQKTLISSWVATISGHSPKLNEQWQLSLLARATNIYFAPSLETLHNKSFRVSKLYSINLERHSILDQLLRTLITRKNFQASPEDLQREVWGQSLSSRGFRQKIRNSIMRIRDSFPYTIAPLILQGDNQIRLFREAIYIKSDSRKTKRIDLEVKNLLKSQRLSSLELCKELNKSPATTKRILKELMERGKITSEKTGRTIKYSYKN